MAEDGNTRFRIALTIKLLIVSLTALLIPISIQAERRVDDASTSYAVEEAVAAVTEDGNALLATFFGGSGRDGHSETPIAIDSDGHVFVATRTSSVGLPTTPGAFDDAIDGTYDLIVAKFSADLSTLLACTYLGGSGDEGEWPGVSLVIDPQDNLIVTSSVSSVDYPTTAGAYCDTLTGDYDIAVSRISNDLTTVIASTYLGGFRKEWYQKAIILNDGRIVVTGCTNSNDFPVTEGAFDEVYGGSESQRGDVFVSILDSGLTTLLASTYLGSGGEDIPECLVAAPGGGVLVGGWTASSYFPTTPGTLFPNITGIGYWDGFISHLSDDLSELVASTYIGGNDWDFVYGLGVDGSGDVLVTGHTASSVDFPVTDLAFDTEYTGGGADFGDDCYVMKLTPDLSTVLACTYLGGSGWEIGECVLADDEGRIFVAGNTNSTNFPYSPGTFDSTVVYSYKYASDVFVCCFDSDLQTLLFGSILGGTDEDDFGSIAFGATGNVYVGGATGAPDFPTSPTAYDTTFNGGAWQWGGDVFIAAFSRGYWHDTDRDGHFDLLDNCPQVSNPEQEDSDNDGVGDSCDVCYGHDDAADADGDLVPDGCDDCTDTDGDGYGNPGYPANTCSVDNCPDVANSDQSDTDRDGIGDACCCLLRGDVDHSGTRDISDLTYYVSYMFSGGAIAPCPEEGDIDGNGTLDISDLTYYVDFMFGGSAEPPPCPY